MSDSSVTAVLDRCARDPRPRLTWYGDDGERVELTGPGLAQWVTKAANLLVEELSPGPGYRVLLDLPGHWRAVVWALAVWRVGACVVVGTPDEVPDAVVTTSPSSFAGRRDLVAVALPALARSFAAPLPPGAIDGAAVLGHGDVLGYAPPVDLAAPGLVGPQAGKATHADLVRGGDAGAAGRVLVWADEEPLDELLLHVLGALAAGGSVVLVGGSLAAELRANDERRGRLVASERVTA